MKLQMSVIFLTSLFILGGCGNNNDAGNEDSSKTALIRTTNPPPVAAEDDSYSEKHAVRDIKDEVLSYEKIYDAAVIKGKKDVLIAYKVKHLHRFRMKQIEKELKKKLESKFKDEQFTVSSDYKIFLEAVKLQEKTDKKDMSADKIEKELQKIVKLSREKT